MNIDTGVHPASTQSQSRLAGPYVQPLLEPDRQVFPGIDPQYSPWAIRLRERRNGRLVVMTG